MARKLKNVENETQTLFKLNWQETLKNGENEKYTLRSVRASFRDSGLGMGSIKTSL